MIHAVIPKNTQGKEYVSMEEESAPHRAWGRV